MPQFKLTKAAEGDLDEIWDYTYQRWGESQANKYLNQLNDKFKLLSMMSNLGIECDYISKNLYFHFEGHHYIFYRIQNDCIHIYRILHERMNIQDIVFDN